MAKMAERLVGSQLLGFGKKIVAVGRNYAEHAKELSNPVPQSPVLFLKPTSSYVKEGGSIEISPGIGEVHHEVELGVVIRDTTRDISVSDAMDAVWGYTLALDMTARDLQATAKSKGLPWTVAKGFDTFTPTSDPIPKENLPDPENVELWLKVDGELRQKGNTSDMIFPIATLVSHISSIMTLEMGDVILTGTPSGVGPVLPGQIITAGITDVLEMKFPVVDRKPTLHKL